jgi:hypothetical protein
MADTLRIKRRLTAGGAGAPAALKNAEMAYNESSDILYYGKGDSAGNATSIVPIGGPGAFQPLDADLTAIAALTGTNVIYYRSAANTWAAITIGTGLTFTAGTLAATGGGGGISEPVGDGFYGRNMASSVGSWVAAVKKAGDTMTGTLTVLPGAGTDGVTISSAAGQARLVAAGSNTDVGFFCTTKGAGGAWYFYTNSYASMQVSIVHQAQASSLYMAGGDGSVTPYNIWKNTGDNVKTQTPIAASNDTSIATTAFVQSARGSLVTKTAAYNVAATDRNALFSVSGSWTLGHTVTAATAGAGFRYTIQNTGMQTVTIDPAGSETIDGTTTLKCLAKEQFDVVCDGTNWITVGRKAIVAISTTVIAAATNIVIFTLPPDYSSFEIIGDFLLTSSGLVQLQGSTDGGASWLAGAYYLQFTYSNGGGVYASYANAGNIWYLTSGSSYAGTSGSFVSQLFPDPLGGSARYQSNSQLIASGGGDTLVSQFGGYVGCGGARLNQILLSPSGGNFNVGTKFILRGRI